MRCSTHFTGPKSEVAADHQGGQREWRLCFPLFDANFGFGQKATSRSIRVTSALAPIANLRDAKKPLTPRPQLENYSVLASHCDFVRVGQQQKIVHVLAWIERHDLVRAHSELDVFLRF